MSLIIRSEYVHAGRVIPNRNTHSEYKNYVYITALSPVHTSCECECDTNVDVTNSQRKIRSSSTLLNSLMNVAAKGGSWRQIHVKFASHEVWSMNQALLRSEVCLMILNHLLLPPTIRSLRTATAKQCKPKPSNCWQTYRAAAGP